MSGAPSEDEMLDGFHSTTADVVAANAAAKPEMNEIDRKKHQRSIIDRIVRLEEDKKGLSNDIKEIYTEAQSAGFSKQAVRKNVVWQMEDGVQKAAREAVEAEAEQMRIDLGDYATSPLGQAAVSRGKH